MANPQPTDAHLRIAHSIQEEIMMRDFTKRQRAILDLILRLSWGCGKKSAVIPKQRDFELVGISENKIKSELEWLCNARVITWGKQTNEYEFNKDYDEWKISIVPGYNRNRFNELLTINIQTSQNGKLLDELATSQNRKYLDEKGRNFPSRGEEVFPSTPTDERLEEVPKESIKESIQSSSCSSTACEEAEEERKRQEGRVFKFFHDNITATPAAIQHEEICHCLDEGMEPDLVIEAIRDSVGAKFNKWNLLQKILNECSENRIYTLDQYNARKKEHEEAKSRDRPPGRGDGNAGHKKRDAGDGGQPISGIGIKV